MLLIRQQVMTLIPLLATVISALVLQDASESQLEAVHQRLTEEKMQRLLLQNDVDNLMLRIAQLERGAGTDTSPEQEEQKQEIFFNARLPTLRTEVAGGTTLIFDEVVEKSGEGYDAATGVFTAPVTGMYSFSVTILSSQKGKHTHIRIMKNEKEIGRTFAGSDKAAWPQTGSITLTTHLNVGDEVYPSQEPKLTGYVYGNNYASFSGYLIK